MDKVERKTRPEWLKTYYTRPESEMSSQLNRAIKRIGDIGVQNFDRKELKQVGLPIIREARARMRQLESCGLTDSPAYIHMKNLDIKISTGGQDLNTIRQNVMQAYNFLHTKTSTVEGASHYSSWLDSHLGSDTTVEQREKIWDVVHRFEETHPQHFINYSYDETIKRIGRLSKLADFDADKAYEGLLNLLEKERELDVEGYEPETSPRRSTWFRGRSSTNDF